MGTETILAAMLMIGFTWHTHNKHEQMDRRLEEIEREIETQEADIDNFSYYYYEDAELP